jgi:hypothetical protein
MCTLIRNRFLKNGPAPFVWSPFIYYFCHVLVDKKIEWDSSVCIGKTGFPFLDKEGDTHLGDDDDSKNKSVIL